MGGGLGRVAGPRHPSIFVPPWSARAYLATSGLTWGEPGPNRSVSAPIAFSGAGKKKNIEHGMSGRHPHKNGQPS
jgi:hypothetical protein